MGQIGLNLFIQTPQSISQVRAEDFGLPLESNTDLFLSIGV